MKHHWKQQSLHTFWLLCLSNFFPYAVYCSKTLEQFSRFSERNINSKMLSLEVSPYCSCRKESTYNPHHGHQSFSKRNISCIFRQKSHTIRGTLLERYAFLSEDMLKQLLYGQEKISLSPGIGCQWRAPSNREQIVSGQQGTL